MESQGSITVGVPKNIYEVIEDTLEANVYKLVCDLTKTLNVDKKFLMKELKKDKINLYTFEDGSEVNIRCKSYTQIKNLYTPCKHPILYGEQYCIIHLENPVSLPEKPIIVGVLQYDNNIYYRTVENIVYDSEIVLFGRWDAKNQRIIEIILDQ